MWALFEEKLGLITKANQIECKSNVGPIEGKVNTDNQSPWFTVIGRHNLSKFCIRMVDELEKIFDQLKRLKKEETSNENYSMKLFKANGCFSFAFWRIYLVDEKFMYRKFLGVLLWGQQWHRRLVFLVQSHHHLLTAFARHWVQITYQHKYLWWNFRLVF